MTKNLPEYVVNVGTILKKNMTKLWSNFVFGKRCFISVFFLHLSSIYLDLSIYLSIYL